MDHRITAVAIAACFSLPVLADGQPAVGEMAPEFRLQDQNDGWHTLEDYRGQWVTLYFYPKADTPGCTTEACNFRDDIFQFQERGVVILGVSVDDVESQADFSEKYHLNFPLLSDRDKQVTEAYGVLKDYVVFVAAHRETFIIDPEGRVAKHYADVDPDVHSAEVLADLDQLIPPAPTED